MPARLRALLPLAVWALFGALDAVLGLVGDASTTRLRGMAVALVPAMGLWVLGAATLWVAVALVTRLAFAATERHDLRRRVRAGAVGLWRDRGSEESRRLAAQILGALVALAAFGATSVAVGNALITHRHGGVLISLTLVALQIPMAAGAWLLGRVVARIAGAVLAVAARRRGLVAWASAPGVVAVLALGAAVGVALLAHRFSETLTAVDGGALALGACAAAAFAAAWLFVNRAASASLFGAVTLLAVAAAALGFCAPTARSYALTHMRATKYALAFAAARTDFDGDGTPSFPGWEDCAPFDAARHPFALEVPKNGVDENCDGSDALPAGFVLDHPHPRPSRRIEPQPNLVLLTIDSTRADHMGFLGYTRRPTTPRLDAFAKEGVVFAHAFSQDSGTGPSTWSLLAGRTPFQVQFSDASRFPFVISDKETLLAEHLARAGYQTSAVLCGAVFGKRRWNIRRGFTDYREVCASKPADEAAAALAAAKQALAALDPARPSFLWVHFYDPHHPYADDPNLDFGTAKMDLYDEEIRRTDTALGQLIDAIRQGAGPRATFIAFTADHGENFGEHGSAYHARNLYREVTHVPLLWLGPGLTSRRIDAVVAQADLHPTFLDFAGVPVPARVTQTSQFNVLFGATPDRTRLVFQENSFSRPLRHTRAVVSETHHLIFDTTNRVLELYDWRADPREAVDLYGMGEPEEPALRQALLQFLTTTALPKDFHP